MFVNWKREVIEDTVYTTPSKEYVDKKLEESTMNKAQNYAPKEIEGNYFVTIKGNKVSVARAYASANTCSDHRTYRCHPDDKFNLMECIKMYNEPEQIKAGDVVNIINRGGCYDLATYLILEIAKRHPDEHDRILLGWTKNNIPPMEYQNVRVVDVIPHSLVNEVKVALVNVEESYYLMDIKALEKVK